MCLILSENWTMSPGRDLPALVRWAREAEDAGFDSVMVSEHIVLGPAAARNGLMANPREYALPGNQDPATPWPSSVVLLSAIAAVTERVRLVAGAVIAPLRHPLLIARELGSLDLISGGRLVVLPTVSWLAEEYAALGVPFGRAVTCSTSICRPGRCSGGIRRLPSPGGRHAAVIRATTVCRCANRAAARLPGRRSATGPPLGYRAAGWLPAA